MVRPAPNWDPLEWKRDDLLIQADDLSDLARLEEMESTYFGDDVVDDVDEAQEWHDYDPDC